MKKRTRSLKRESAYKYVDIIFLQDSDDLPDDFFDWSEPEMVEYLSQWDYGEYSQEVRDNPPCGSSDEVYDDGRYVLCYNERLKYVGLSAKFTEDEFPELWEDVKNIKKIIVNEDVQIGNVVAEKGDRIILSEFGYE